MLLSDKRIVEELKSGNIVIEPFDERQLGTKNHLMSGNWALILTIAAWVNGIFRVI